MSKNRGAITFPPSSRPIGLPDMERKIVVDTREQTPWDFEFLDKTTGELTSYETVTQKIDEGDYELEGLHNVCTIERKSLPDFVQSITHGRERFRAEMERLQSNVEHPFVFIEANVDQVLEGDYLGHTYPRAIIGTALSFAVDFPAVHFVWCGQRLYAKTQAILLFADIERMMKQRTKTLV